MTELSERIRQATKRLQEDVERLHGFELRTALEIIIFQLQVLANDDLELDEAIQREREESQ